MIDASAIFITITWYSNSPSAVTPMRMWVEIHQGSISQTVFHLNSNWIDTGFSVTPLLGIISLQNSAHATTVQLSCHVRNFIAIASLQLEWEQDEISIEIELRWKNRSWHGPQYTSNRPHQSTTKRRSCVYIFVRNRDYIDGLVQKDVTPVR